MNNEDIESTIKLFHEDFTNLIKDSSEKIMSSLN